MNISSALSWSFITGFCSISFEILWIRMFSFFSSGAAQAPGLIIGLFLLGLAGGALWSALLEGRRSPDAGVTLANLLCAAGLAAVPAVPVAAYSARFLPWWLPATVVIVPAFGFGAQLPGLCILTLQAAESVGKLVSRLYFANIIGSGVGSLFTGYVLTDHLSYTQISRLMLGITGAFATWVVFRLNPWRSTGVAAAFTGTLLAMHVFGIDSDLYERLQLKEDFRSGYHFKHVVENRSGIITVSPTDEIYSGGAYDGVMSVSPVDHLMLLRPYALAALHPAPMTVLMIGMSGGAWTQILANNPYVKHLTVVEINRGYTNIIRRYALVSSILDDPKVELVIDDARRWLRRNPGVRFDFIVMNTPLHHRELVSSLLSQEFVESVASHLTRDGRFMWNCTGSARAIQTGLKVFPYAMLVINAFVGSREAIKFDAEKWVGTMNAYKINGEYICGKDPNERSANLAAFLEFLQGGDSPGRIRTRNAMIPFGKGQIPITDDNLGHEFELNMFDAWKRPSLLLR